MADDASGLAVVDRPTAKADYPESWKVWEDEVLAPLLAEDPDRITFTSYE